ncbi:MAG: hypothetical protein WBW88_13370 [Rhodothermales bacterium]
MGDRKTSLSSASTAFQSSGLMDDDPVRYQIQMWVSRSSRML